MENLLPAIVFLSIIPATFNRGFFSPASLVLVLFLLFVLTVINYGDNFKISRRNLQSGLGLIFIGVYLLFLFFNGGIYQKLLIPTMLIHILPLIFIPAVFSFQVIKLRLTSEKFRFFSLISLAFILRILMIIATPEPAIDVFYMLKEAPIRLLSGINPYEAVYSPVYAGVKADYFTYFPGAFLLQIPFVLIFTDPRVLLVFSDIAGGLLLYLVGRKTITAQIIALIYLFRPNSLFIIEQSWLTPLVFFFLASATYLMKYGKEKAERLTAVVLALLASIQPQFIVSLPFFLAGITKRINFLIIFSIILLSVILPFFLINPAAFINDAVLFFFRPSRQMFSVPVYLSLNLNTPYHFLTGRDIPIFITGAIFILITVLLLLKLYKKNYHKSGLKAGIVLANCILYLSFFLLLKFSFINYYYLTSGLVLLYLTILI
ncbi:hypothetical protein A3I80_01155 [Candidatus Gottesmanbacteria bacterium RIFCSPLOWO2_02_FULL_40_10]|nr:MAG: hypothetical protein A3I80_01155 [Candidatus Gottesmanbacteria bacterium RIFCSPLOWO2_02_FULL_40_10]